MGQDSEILYSFILLCNYWDMTDMKAWLNVIMLSGILSINVIWLKEEELFFCSPILKGKHWESQEW